MVRAGEGRVQPQVVNLRPLVLDTNVLNDLSFQRALGSYHGPKLLPAVAYAELAVHVLHRDDTLENLDNILRRAGVDVAWFRHGHARTAARTGALVGDFSENARDHLIAAHAVGPDRVLVTHNITDFTFLGDRALTPARAMERFAG